MVVLYFDFDFSAPELGSVAKPRGGARACVRALLRMNRVVWVYRKLFIFVDGDRCTVQNVMLNH